MSKPFDAATKRLVEADPLAWLRCAGLPGTEAELIDADLATITSEADRFLRVRNPDYLGHIELQAGYESNMGDRALRYNVLGYCKYGLPVQTAVFLLRPEADGPALTGRVEYGVAGSPDCWLSFGYRVVRLWEQNPEQLLNGPLATLPLTPLADVSESALPGVVRSMEARIDTDAPPEDRGMLWATTRLLLGLKYNRKAAQRLLKGVQGMKESDTYLEILEEGAAQAEPKHRADEARRILLMVGGKRFGIPDAQALAKLDTFTSHEQLELLAARLIEVESWQELLQ